MVLAAGLGTRLLPLTSLRPKPLVPLLSQPLICFNLLLLRSFGVSDVVINLHHQGGAVRDALGEGEELGLSLRYTEEPRLLGTGGGVRNAMPWLAERGSFFVLNGDTVLDVDLVEALHMHRSRGALATLLLHEHPEAAAYGAIGLDECGRVRSIASLLGPRPASPYLFSGGQILEPALVERIPPGKPGCILRDAYVPAIRDQAPIFGDPRVSFWADLGTPSRYLAAHRDLLARADLCSHMPRPGSEPGSLPGLKLNPPVQIGPGLVLRGEAELGPHVVLGARVSLAAGIRVENAVVWSGALVPCSLSSGILTDTGVWVET